MEEFHRKTRGIVVLHRCMLNPSTTYTNNAARARRIRSENPGKGGSNLSELT
jgi:hypothetical protein